MLSPTLRAWHGTPLRSQDVFWYYQARERYSQSCGERHLVRGCGRRLFGFIGAIADWIQECRANRGYKSKKLHLIKGAQGELLGLRRKIRSSGTLYEKEVGLSALAYGTIEWLLIYSIRGQDEGINGLLKKRGALIGDGPHPLWIIRRKMLSNRQTMDSVGIKHVAVIKFIVTGQEDHFLRTVHNWRQYKRFFCFCLLLIICR